MNAGSIDMDWQEWGQIGGIAEGRRKEARVECWVHQSLRGRQGRETGNEQERMLSWKPSRISRAPGRKHTRRVTEEFHEEIVFKGVGMLENQDVVVKHTMTGNNGKSQGMDVNWQGWGVVARKQANLQWWGEITQRERWCESEESNPYHLLPGRKVSRKLNFSLIPLSYL